MGLNDGFAGFLHDAPGEFLPLALDRMRSLCENHCTPMSRQCARHGGPGFCTLDERTNLVGARAFDTADNRSVKGTANDDLFAHFGDMEFCSWHHAASLLPALEPDWWIAMMSDSRA